MIYWYIIEENTSLTWGQTSCVNPYPISVLVGIIYYIFSKWKILYFKYNFSLLHMTHGKNEKYNNYNWKVISINKRKSCNLIIVEFKSMSFFYTYFLKIWSKIRIEKHKINTIFLKNIFLHLLLWIFFLNITFLWGSFDNIASNLHCHI